MVETLVLVFLLAAGAVVLGFFCVECWRHRPAEPFLVSGDWNKPRVGRWENAWFCVSCDRELSWETKMRSHGRCPMCGHKGDHAGTVVDCVEKGFRWVDAIDNETGKRVRVREWR